MATFVRPIYAGVVERPPSISRAQLVLPLSFQGVSILLDLASVLIGAFVARACYSLLHRSVSPAHLDLFLTGVVEYWLAYVFLARSCGIYELSHSLLNVRVTEKILRISCSCLIIFNAEMFLLHVSTSRLLLIGGWMITVSLTLVFHHLGRKGMRRLRFAGVEQKSVLILGIDRDARRIFSSLRNSPHWAGAQICFLNEGLPRDLQSIYTHDYTERWKAPVHHGVLTQSFLADQHISEVYAADRSMSPQRLTDIATLMDTHGGALWGVSASQLPEFEGQSAACDLDGMAVSSSSSLFAGRPLYTVAKRVIDIGAAGFLMVFMGPLFLLLAAMVLLSSPGPALFRQQRVGLQGQLFTIFKFRTMYVDAARYSRSPVDSLDPRITRIGRFLRKSSMDELPQIWNVLRGDMSLVGPRPEMPYVVELYTPAQRRRLAVPQGLTGLWQLSADRRHAIHETLEYDLYYTEHRGFFLDLAILCHTCLFAVKGI